MDCLRVKANECKYQERERRLKEQFIIGINDDDVINEIIVRELNTIKKTHEITHKEGRSTEKEKSILYATRGERIWLCEKANYAGNQKSNPQKYSMKPQQKYRYCGIMYEPRWCPAFKNRHTRCGHSSHLERVCRNPSRPALKETGRDRHRAVNEMCQNTAESKASLRGFNAVRSTIFIVLNSW